MAEKSVHLRLRHLSGMPPVVEIDISPHPITVTLLGSRTVMAPAQFGDHSVIQSRPRPTRLKAQRYRRTCFKFGIRKIVRLAQPWKLTGLALIIHASLLTMKCQQESCKNLLRPAQVLPCPSRQCAGVDSVLPRRAMDSSAKHTSLVGLRTSSRSTLLESLTRFIKKCYQIFRSVRCSRCIESSRTTITTFRTRSSLSPQLFSRITALWCSFALQGTLCGVAAESCSTARAPAIR